jgi:hypothetical protein
MWAKLLQMLPVGCRHRHISQPFSSGRSARKSSDNAEWEPVSQEDSGIYVVCLDCGRHFAYDWSRMRMVK